MGRRPGEFDCRAQEWPATQEMRKEICWALVCGFIEPAERCTASPHGWKDQERVRMGLGPAEAAVASYATAGSSRRVLPEGLKSGL